MALNAVYFAVLYLYSLTHCPAAEQNVDCRLVPTRTNISSEFRLKASQNGVRMVYLNLKIGNNSYHPLDVEDEFLPNRWVWANSSSEPMLSLRFDYDILSLGLLSYQVRSMDVPLEDEPRGCLASLNSSCQNKVVGRVLLESVTDEPRYETEVVCVTMIATDFSSMGEEYPSCCSIETFGPGGNFVHCDLTVKSNHWMDTFNLVLYWLKIFACFFLPAFPLVLPDCIFSVHYECDKEDRLAPEQINNGQAEVIPNPTRNGYEEINDCDHEEERLACEIPVDDSSPLTCTTLLVGFVHHLPELRLSFNIKLACLFYLLLPLAGYVHHGLWFAFKERYILESYRKHVNLPGQSIFVGVSPWYIACCFVPGLAFVLFLRPKDLFFPHEMCPLCKAGTLFAVLPLPTCIYTPRVNHSIGDEMLYHLKRLSYLPSLVWNIIQFHINGLKNLLHRCTCLLSSQSTSRTRRALGVSCALFSLLFIMFFGFVFGTICLVLVLFASAVFFFYFSPLGSLSILFAVKFLRSEIFFLCLILRSVAKSLMQLLLILLILLSGPMFFASIIIPSLIIVISMFGYLTMGLVLNADIVFPYLAFFIVATTNIYLCYGNVQKRCKDFKRITSKCWQKEQSTSNSDNETIPTHLFWFVSDRVLPVSTEICQMLCSITLIVIFLFLILLSVLLFRSTYNISAVVSTISVLISGVIPRLLFRGGMLKGWEKIKLKREIENAVKTFQEINGVNNRATDSSQITGAEQV